MSFGFGGGFGASSSPFGTTSLSPFGQTAPAFGQSTSPFGATSTTGVFGQQSQPAFGSAAPAFGAASTTSAFGTSAFGAKPAGGFGFGAQSTTPAFGAVASTPAFGAASSSAFGAPSSSPFGGAGTSTFGQPAATSTFGQAPTSAFGQAPTSAFGTSTFGAQQPQAGTTTTGFGAQPGFGAAATPTGRGSRVAPWRKTQETDTSSTGAKSTVYYNSISCMPEYANKSAEEIRCEDYEDGVKGGGGAAGAAGVPQASGGLFGQPVSAGGAGAAPSPFGAAPSSTAFGGFGAAGGSTAPAPAFGASSAPAFGGFGAPSTTTTTTPFGASSTPAFGAAAPAPSAFGGFGGAASAPAFGAAPASTPAFGFGGGATMTPTSAFGAPAAASTPAFGGFGAAPAATTTSPFGAAPTGFGAQPQPGGTSTPAFSFPSSAQQNAPLAFGAAPAATAPSAFEAAPAAGAPSLFGGISSTPAFGAAPGAAPSSSLFASAQKPATAGGFSFAGATTPAFGAASTPAFGTGGGLFGGPAATTPAFNTTPGTGGGLFGGIGGAGAQTQSPFSFSPQSTPAPGGLSLAPTPTLGLGSTPLFGAGQQQQQQQQFAAGSTPYGTLPEAPRVTPLPEYKVGLTQRMLAPPSGGPPRPVAFITPRSLTPLHGGKLRPRRASSAAAPGSLMTGTRLSRNPSEFFAAVNGLGPVSSKSTPFEGGVSSSPGGALAIGNGSASGNNGTNIFVPRDNPRKLFIRDSLPSTEAAGGVSVTPSSAAAAGRGGVSTPGRALSTPGSRAGVIHPEDRGAIGDGSTPQNGTNLTPHGNLTDAEISILLPSLSRPEYYTEPSLAQLAAMAREEPSSLAEVANFTVGKRGVGSIRWLDPVDVRGVALDEIVELARGSVEVYLEGKEKPEVGDGLNKPAEVTMLKIFKMEKSTGKPTQDPEVVERFTRKLKKIAAEQSARFISYDGHAGVWKFEVEHFSRYGLHGDSDDDDDNNNNNNDQGGGGEPRPSGDHQDFDQGDDRIRMRRHERDAVEHELEDDDDDDEIIGFGVRRAAPNQHAAYKGKEAAVAGEDMNNALTDSAGTAPWHVDVSIGGHIDGTPRTDNSRGGTVKRGLTSAKYQQQQQQHQQRALHVVLPERLKISAEDLYSTRTGLYPNEAHDMYQSKYRKIENTSPQQQQQQPLPKNAWHTRCPSLMPPTQALLSPPLSLQQGSHSITRAHSMGLQMPTCLIQSTPPTLPSTAHATDSSISFESSRCLPDSGRFLGGSFRVGWAPNAVYCSHIAGGSAARIALKQISPLLPLPLESKGGHEPSKMTMEMMRRRLESQLQLHFQYSSPSSIPGNTNTNTNKSSDNKNSINNNNSRNLLSAPLWQLKCKRDQDVFQHIIREYIKILNENTSGLGGEEKLLDRTVLKHQSSAWELIYALFSALPAETSGSFGVGVDGKNGNTTVMMDDDNNNEDGNNNNNNNKGGGREEDEDDVQMQQRLVSMQRRAKLSHWLKERSRSIAERTACTPAPSTTTPSTPPTDSDTIGGVGRRIIALLSGYQLTAAATLAASTGNVRLATILSSSGLRSSAKEQIAQQLLVWKDAEFVSHIDGDLLQVYRLLSGDVQSTIPFVADTDWRRALGMHLWYALPPTSSIAAVLEEYTAAAEDGVAPPPLPPYAVVLLKQGVSWRALSSGGKGVLAEKKKVNENDDTMKEDDRDVSGNIAFDVNYELLRLYCAASSDEHDVHDVVPSLLRPAGVTPDPLDASFSWHMLCMLRAINVVTPTPAELDLPMSDDMPCTPASETTASIKAQLSTTMSFISQLESLGGLSHWSIYVALHIPYTGIRNRVVKELLSLHCSEWSDDDSQGNIIASFLLDDLRIPKEWLAEARAVYSRYRGDDIALLEDLIESGDVAAAHQVLCESVAPAWLMSGSSTSTATMIKTTTTRTTTALSNLSDVLRELEPMAASIDENAGAGTYWRGAGMYSAFLLLRDVYSSLDVSKTKTTRRRTSGGGGDGGEKIAVDVDDLETEDTNMMSLLGDTTYEQRMQACSELSMRLNAAGTALDVIARRNQSNTRGIPLRRAALAMMSQELSSWVLSDAHGEGAVPGAGHALLVAGMGSLRHGTRMNALQMGIASVADGI